MLRIRAIVCANQTPQYDLSLTERVVLGGRVRFTKGAKRLYNDKVWGRSLRLADERFQPHTTPYPLLANLLQELTGSAKPFVIGGALRDVVIAAVHRWAAPVFDVDLVLETDLSLDALEAIARKAVAALRIACEPTRTSFGGIRIDILESGKSTAANRFPIIDVWRLQDSYQVQVFGQPATIEAVVDHAGITLAAIAYSTDDRVIIDGGCASAVMERKIEFSPLYRRPAQIAKALELEKRLGFQFTQGSLAALRRMRGEVMDQEVGRNLKRHHEPHMAAALFARWVVLSNTSDTEEA